MLNYLGQEIPVTNFNMGGGVALRPTDQDVALARLNSQNNNMERMADQYLPPPSSHGGGVGPVSSSSGKGIAELLKGLFGGGLGEAGSQQQIQSGDTSINSSNQGTINPLTQLMASLFGTAGSVRTGLANVGGGVLNNLVDKQATFGLANQNSENSANKANWVREIAASMIPSLRGNTTTQNFAKVNPSDLGRGTPINAMMNQGLDKDPMGILGNEEQAPLAPEGSGDVSRRLMAGGGVKRFRPSEYVS